MLNFVEGKIPEQKFQEGHPFPKVVFPFYNSQREGEGIVATEEEKAWIQRELHNWVATEEEKAWIQRELHNCGAILLRGFGIKTAADFHAFVETLGWEEQPYKGPAPRKNIIGRVWSANEAPLDQHIFFHHEMALTKEFPSKILFFCEVAPPEEGETGIVRSDIVARHMEKKFPRLVQQLDRKGILTCTLLPKENNLGYFLGKSWQSHLQTNDPEDARRKVEEGGGKLQWRADGSANIVAGPLPAMRTFESQGGYRSSEAQPRKVWFNYIPGATYGKAGSYNRLLCGDGSDIPQGIMEESRKVMEEECVEVKWEAGDVLLIDNLHVMHARRPSLAPRRVLVALCK